MDNQMLQTKLQDYILNIPVGKEINLEVLLRIVLQLTDMKFYNSKHSMLEEMEKMLQSYCNKGIIKKEEERYIRVERQQDLGERE